LPAGGRKFPNPAKRFSDFDFLVFLPCRKVYLSTKTENICSFCSLVLHRKKGIFFCGLSYASFQLQMQPLAAGFF